MISENTTNLSFKQLQYKLQDEGVENFYFMNELHDKDLDGVDVYTTIDKYRHDTRKKSSFIDKVKKECRENVWYYLREVVRIPDEYHIEAGICSGLSKYPVTERFAKLIYLYDKGFTSIICSGSKSTLLDVTMAALALREEYLLTRGIDYNSSIVKLYSEEDELIKFRNLVHSLLWATNDVIGSIDGMSYIDTRKSTNNYGIFNDIGSNVKLYEGRNSLIAPHVENNEDLEDFLYDIDNRYHKNVIGVLYSNGDNATLNILERFLFSKRFIRGNKELYDTNTNDIRQFDIYLV